MKFKPNFSMLIVNGIFILPANALLGAGACKMNKGDLIW